MDPDFSDIVIRATFKVGKYDKKDEQHQKALAEQK